MGTYYIHLFFPQLKNYLSNPYIVIVFMVRLVQELCRIGFLSRLKDRKGRGQRWYQRGKFSERGKTAIVLWRRQQRNCRYFFSVCWPAKPSQTKSSCIHVHLSVHLSRLKMGHLQVLTFAMSPRPIAHWPRLYNTARMCCSVNTACLLPFRRLVVTQTATGSPRAWPQTQVKVTTSTSVYIWAKIKNAPTLNKLHFWQISSLSLRLASKWCVSHLMASV